MGCNCAGQTRAVRSYKRANNKLSVVGGLAQQGQQFLLFIESAASPLLLTGDVSGHVYEFGEGQRLRGVFVSDVASLMLSGQFVRVVPGGG